MKTVHWLIFLSLSLVSCSKEDVPQPNSIIGEWNIVQMDEVFAVTGMPVFSPNYVSTIPWTGKMIFDHDSSGQFLPAIPVDTDTVDTFTWSHNKKTNRILFNTSKGPTYAIIKYQVADTLEFYLRSYTQYVGATRMFDLKMSK